MNQKIARWISETLEKSAKRSVGTTTKTFLGAPKLPAELEAYKKSNK